MACRGHVVVETLSVRPTTSICVTHLVPPEPHFPRCRQVLENLYLRVIDFIASKRAMRPLPLPCTLWEVRTTP